MNRAAPGGVVWVGRQQGDVVKVTRMVREDHVGEMYDGRTDAGRPAPRADR